MDIFAAGALFKITFDFWSFSIIDYDIYYKRILQVHAENLHEKKIGLDDISIY